MVVFIKDELIKIATKMRAIREALKWTQLTLATNMECSVATVENYESGRHKVTSATIIKFKKAVEMDVPLTDDEIAAHKKVLYRWIDYVVLGDKKKADKLYVELTTLSKWSFDDDVINLRNLFCVGYYYYSNGKREKCLEILKSLSQQIHELSDEHLYWYYRYSALMEHSVWRYKTALEMYLKAEKLGDRLGLTDRGLLHNIGYCYAEMGYSYFAILYLERVLTNKVDTFSITIKSGFSTQRLLAICYSDLGKKEEAHALFDNCLIHIEAENRSDKFILGGTYLDMGKVYEDEGEYEKALEYYEMASRQYDKNSEAFIEYLCIIASLLRSIGREDEAKEYLSQGLPLVTKDTLWYWWLHAIDKSMDMDNDASIIYIECTVVPALHDYGKHTFAIMCCEWIDKYYRDKNMYKKAIKYIDKANEIRAKLQRGVTI